MTKIKTSLRGVWASFLATMHVLSVLVRMQLKEKMDVSYLRSPRKTIFKAVWFIIEFAGITALISVVFYFVKVFGLFSLVHDIPVPVVSIVFAVMLLLSLITDTVGQRIGSTATSTAPSAVRWFAFPGEKARSPLLAPNAGKSS